MAAVFDAPAAGGLLAGSVSLIGGHGTAIAWAPRIREDYGIESAMEIGIACATFGLILASLMGGPIAKFLINRHKLTPEHVETQDVVLSEKQEEKGIGALDFLDAILAIHISGIFGILLNEAVATTAQTGRMLSVLLLDLDRFKPVNDTFGHPVGDKLLQEISQRLADMMPEKAIFARIGGDEFAILLPDVVGIAAAQDFAQFVTDELERPYVIDGTDLNVGGSIGIAVYPQHGANAQERECGAELNYDDADIRAVVDEIAMRTGRTFLLDPRVQGRVTVKSPPNGGICADEAWELFQAMLRVNGFAATPIGANKYKIVPVQEGPRAAGPDRRELSERSLRFRRRNAQVPDGQSRRAREPRLLDGRAARADPGRYQARLRLRRL